MPDLHLKPNQAALILEASDDGEISVDIALPKNGTDMILASVLCQAIAEKLINDEKFQEEICSGFIES